MSWSPLLGSEVSSALSPWASMELQRKRPARSSVFRRIRHWLQQVGENDDGHMMASSDGNIFHITGLLCREFTGHRWIPCPKASNMELWCFLWSKPEPNSWANNGDAGDLRRHHTHYDVIVMIMPWKCFQCDMTLCEGNLLVVGGFPSQRASSEELWCCFCG